MEKESKNVCEKCNKSFATKYTLKNHIESKICDNKNDSTSCSSKRCSYKSLSRSDLQKHLKVCKYVEIDTIVDKIKEEHKKEIQDYDNRIKNLIKEHKKEVDDLNKEHKKDIDHLNDIIRVKEEYIKNDQERMTSLLEKVVSKPVITTNNTTNNNIRGNNNNLQSILADPDLYKKQVDPDRIKNIDHEIIEEHFWNGQKGMARLCVDHIIKTSDKDGNKYLLRCTDPSRKRFKYIDTTNKIAEDMEARNFISLVSVPIKTVCRDVYDKIVKKLEDDKKDTDDIYFVESKTIMAHQKFSEINDIADHSRNSEYKNEMSILLNDY
jgi:hypothetical protein